MDRIRGHMRCSSQPLCEVFLLGRLLQWNGRVIMLCPFPGCGLPMVYHPDHCDYTSFGYICTVCTQTRRAVRAAQRRVIPELTKTGHVTHQCTFCTRELVPQRRCFIYPHGVLVCTKHHTRAQADYIRQCHPMTRADTILCITAFTTMCKEQQALLFAQRDRSALNNRRRLDRQKQMTRYVM